MTRRTFLEPCGELGALSVIGTLGLIGIDADPSHVDRWTAIELLVAYDYAMREHLHASDNPIRRRPCPSFVKAAERRACRACFAIITQGPIVCADCGAEQ